MTECKHAVYDFCMNAGSDHNGLKCPGNCKLKQPADAGKGGNEDADSRTD